MFWKKCVGFMLNAYFAYYYRKDDNMETVNLLVDAVNAVGYQVVMIGIAFWYINHRESFHDEERADLRKSYSDSIERLTTLHSEETEKLTVALNNNTLVLTKLTERLERKD